ncbi:hypothetical protein OH492_23265 [Vibrio chagasii]|nr:hypothetical protein [Vibrio chagasii]
MIKADWKVVPADSNFFRVRWSGAIIGTERHESRRIDVQLLRGQFFGRQA